MRIVISDDYQDAVRSLACFGRMAGHEVKIFNDTVKGVDALAARFADAEALVLIRERTRVDAALLERLPRLKLISQTGRSGPQIDVDACTRRGVLVCQTSGSSYSTAELTWGLALAASRHIALEDRRMRAGRWQTTLGTSLHGRMLGIYGYGKIGKIVAGYGKAFGMRTRVLGR
jgi:D-3-phosphoglycerate dehydrogenase